MNNQERMHVVSKAIIIDQEKILKRACFVFYNRANMGSVTVTWKK